MDRQETVPVRAHTTARCTPDEQPRPESGLRPGQGRLATALVDGASAIVACVAASPLQILSPSPRGDCAWFMPASHGGGLVAGDHVSLEVDVGEATTALLSTQAGTKVYRTPGPLVSQRLSGRVGRGAVLAHLPHPVSCFAGARYSQEQRFELAAGASLLWLDALTAGRVARGERWAFDEYRSRLEVAVAGRGVLVDAPRLLPGEGLPVAERLAGFELLATLVAVGPALAAHARSLLEAIAAAPAKPGADVLAAASPLAGGVLVRVAARRIEGGLAFLRERLGFVEAVVRVDPFARTP
jgi:urease accessory protein